MISVTINMISQRIDGAGPADGLALTTTVGDEGDREPLEPKSSDTISSNHTNRIASSMFSLPTDFGANTAKMLQ